MRCEGLLSTLTRGSLQVTFGAQAALPIAIAPEPLERILVNLVKNAARATGTVVRCGLAWVSVWRRASRSCSPPLEEGLSPQSPGSRRRRRAIGWRHATRVGQRRRRAHAAQRV